MKYEMYSKRTYSRSVVMRSFDSKVTNYLRADTATVGGSASASQIRTAFAVKNVVDQLTCGSH